MALSPQLIGGQPPKAQPSNDTQLPPSNPNKAGSPAKPGLNCQFAELVLNQWLCSSLHLVWFAMQHYRARTQPIRSSSSGLAKHFRRHELIQFPRHHLRGDSISLYG